MVFSQIGVLGLGKGNIVEVQRLGFVCVSVYVSLECLIFLEVIICIVQSIRGEIYMILEVRILYKCKIKRGILMKYFYFILFYNW